MFIHAPRSPKNNRIKNNHTSPTPMGLTKTEAIANKYIFNPLVPLASAITQFQLSGPRSAALSQTQEDAPPKTQKPKCEPIPPPLLAIKRRLLQTDSMISSGSVSIGRSGPPDIAGRDTAVGCQRRQQRFDVLALPAARCPQFGRTKPVPCNSLQFLCPKYAFGPLARTLPYHTCTLHYMAHSRA